MPSTNARIADAVFSHAVALGRFEAGAKQRVLRLLTNLEGDLVRELAAADPTGVARTAFQQRRLETLLAATRRMLRTAHRDIARVTQTDLRTLTQLEHQAAVTMLNTAIGIDLVQPTLDVPTLRALADDLLIQGAPSATWWDRQGTALWQRFADTLRQGILRQEPLAQLVQRVRGTRQGGFQNGVLRASRAAAERLVRSSVQTVANQARLASYQAHDDLIHSVIWRATLDGRTTIICAVRDGKAYTLTGRPLGHDLPFGPGPGAIHWSCRSTLVPRTKSWAELSRRNAVQTGGRPTSIRRAFERRLREKGLDAEEAAAQIFQARSSMDGSVPDQVTFPQWLRQRDAATPGFGARVLGRGRWNLWRSGKLSFSDLVNFNGEPWTIEQLRTQIVG